jgi:hypothetical protein
MIDTMRRYGVKEQEETEFGGDHHATDFAAVGTEQATQR